MSNNTRKIQQQEVRTHVVLFTCRRFNAGIYAGDKTTTYIVVDWSIGRSRGRNKTSPGSLGPVTGTCSHVTSPRHEKNVSFIYSLSSSSVQV